MKILHLIRDGRAFCFSYLKNYQLPPTALPMAGRNWLRNIAMVDRFRSIWPQTPLLEVRYEDLCRNLPETMRRVTQFLEVPYESAIERPDAKACHVLGNRMRLTFGGQIQECRRWQRELTPQQIEYLQRALGPSLGRYHYSF